MLKLPTGTLRHKFINFKHSMSLHERSGVCPQAEGRFCCRQPASRCGTSEEPPHRRAPVSPGADDFGQETMKWQTILPHPFGILTNSSISLLRQIRVRDYPSRCASTPLRRLCGQADRRRWNARAVARRPMPCSARTHAPPFAPLAWAHAARRISSGRARVHEHECTHLYPA